MVTYSQASAAAPIKANIDEANNMLSQINAFSGKVSIVTVGLGLGQGAFNAGDVYSQSESDTLWNALFSIYNNRLTNYNSQLAAV